MQKLVVNEKVVFIEWKNKGSKHNGTGSAAKKIMKFNSLISVHSISSLVSTVSVY